MFTQFYSLIVNENSGFRKFAIPVMQVDKGLSGYGHQSIVVI